MKAAFSPQRWQEIQRFFDEVGALGPEARAARLDAARADDPALCGAVESMLAALDQPGAASVRAGAARIDRGVRVGPYEVMEKLGGGGMGVVYKALDTRLKRIVALKFLPTTLNNHPESKRRFEHEAQAASSLDHLNICTIHDTGQADDGQLFIAMAFYQGETLKKKIARGPLPVEEALSYAAQAARGLAKAHEKGIVHRDVKPANIMVTDDGVVKVVDFGLAKMSDVQLTRTGATMGTVAYMSPEQARGAAVDHRTDVWSLGVVLYEMLTGVRPFPGEHEQAILYALLNIDPPSVSAANPALPEGLDHVVAMCLEREKDFRYPTMNDLLADLEVLIQHSRTGMETATGLSTTAGERFRQRIRSHLWRKIATAGAGMLAVLLVVLGIVSLRRTALPAQQHLAVLPFSVAEAGLVEQSFADGLVETFRTTLARLEQSVDSLWVVPSEDMREYPAANPDEARQLFGVNLAVQGRVERAGERLRLALNLVDTRTQRRLRSARIEGQDIHDAVFQAGLLTTVADLLDLELTPDERRAFNTGGTTQSDAYVFYTQGRGYLQRYDQIGPIDTAISLFESALDEDASYALAYAGLGEAYWRKFNLTKDAQWIEKAGENCERAAALDTDLAPVYVTCGLIHTARGRYGTAAFLFNQAIQHEPLNAAAYRGFAALQVEMGHPEAAEETYKKAIALKPEYWGGYYDLGNFYQTKGRFQEAMDQFQHVIDLTPDNFLGYSKVGTQHYRLGDRQQARAMWERSIEVKPNLLAYSSLAALQYGEGNYEQAAKMYEEMLALQDTDYKIWGNLANSYYWSGARARANRAWQTMITMAEEHLKINPRDAEVLGVLAGATSKIGDREKAFMYIDRLLALDRQDAGTLFDAAKNYDVLGERDLALQYLEAALANGQSLVSVESSAWLKDLRDDPRYATITEPYRALRE